MRFTRSFNLTDKYHVFLKNRTSPEVDRKFCTYELGRENRRKGVFQNCTDVHGPRQSLTRVSTRLQTYCVT